MDRVKFCAVNYAIEKRALTFNPIPLLSQICPRWLKRHSDLWAEGQNTQASASGQKSLLNKDLVMLFSEEFLMQPCISYWHTDPLAGTFQHPLLWRQMWLLSHTVHFSEHEEQCSVEVISSHRTLLSDYNGERWLTLHSVDLAGYQIPGLWN